MNPLLSAFDRTLYSYLGHFAKPDVLSAGHNTGPVSPNPLEQKAGLMEAMRQERLAPTPMDSGSFFRRKLQEGIDSGNPSTVIPLK